MYINVHVLGSSNVTFLGLFGFLLLPYFYNRASWATLDHLLIYLTSHIVLSMEVLMGPSYRSNNFLIDILHLVQWTKYIVHPLKLITLIY